MSQYLGFFTNPTPKGTPFPNPTGFYSMRHLSLTCLNIYPAVRFINDKPMAWEYALGMGEARDSMPGIMLMFSCEYNHLTSTIISAHQSN
jgi:hypothetical protein